MPELVNISGKGEVSYNIVTTPSSYLQFNVKSSDASIVRYNSGKIQGVKNGTAKIYADLKVGTQIMRLESMVNVTNITPTNPGTGGETTPTISEADVLKHFGLTKKDGYIIGFKLGDSVANVRRVLSSYPNVKLSSFKNSSGGEITNGTISTNMRFTLTFNQKQYNYIVVIKGDVNGDGLIYATDYVKIKNHIMGKQRLEGAYLKAADINNDNNIYATDYVRIKNYIMGKGKIEQI